MFREVHTNTSSTINSRQNSEVNMRQEMKMQSKDIRKSLINNQQQQSQVNVIHSSSIQPHKTEV